MSSFLASLAFFTPTHPFSVRVEEGEEGDFPKLSNMIIVCS